MAHEILVYTAKKSSRLRYVFDLMLRNLLGLEITFTDKADVFRSHVGPKLSYSDHQLADEPFFFASRILFEKGIEDQQINVFDWKGIPAFFGTHPKYIIPFDLFAASFYLVSRYEEYLPHIKDDHMRFSPQQSLAYQKNFLNKPLVNIYALELKKILQQYYPQLQFKDTHYRYISTFDIDSAYAYHEKGIVRHFGAFALSLFKFNFRKIAERISVLFGWEKDPYDTYEWQLEISKKYNLKTIYFFLVGDYGEFDKNIPLEGSRIFQTLIKSIADYAEVGVHPSYYSNSNRDQLRKEIKRL